MNASKIYLHWTGTGYDWVRSNHYHSIVRGDGSVKHLHSYDVLLPTHTWKRNHGSLGLAVACMGGREWIDYPPTEAQIEALCLETAKVALHLQMKPEDVSVRNILTHAEAAALRDFPKKKAQVEKVSGFPASEWPKYLKRAQALGLPHHNYGPSHWSDGWPGSYVYRWDLWKLRPEDPDGSGGDLLREKIVLNMRELLVKSA